nr:AAA family ATPase [Lactococcus lactis]
MVMQIKPAGTRSPKLTRVLISGGGLSGKTTLAAKFASSNDRALFISTDGNAYKQGYQAIDFEFPQKAEQIITNFTQALNMAEQNAESWDVLVIDLIEDFDERAQTLLRGELNNFKSTMKAWGKINSLYKDMQSLMMSKFHDKTIVLLSRDVEEIDQKSGEVIGYKPALRKSLKNIILKDQDVEIRAYFDRSGNRQFDISNLRYEEMKGMLQQIISKPFEIPQPAVSKKEQQEVQEKANKLKEQYDKAFAAAASHNASDRDIEYWKNMEPSEAIMSIADWIRIKESAQTVVDEEEPIMDELFPVGQN